MQKTAVYDTNMLSNLQRRLDKLIEEGNRIVQVIHYTEPKLVPYLDDRIHALVIYEPVEGTVQ
jgi:hypothetical protein